MTNPPNHSEQYTRMINPLIRLLALLAALCCASLTHAAGIYNIGPGDIVKITVYDQPDLTTEARINEAGTISFPLIGDVQIGGQTATEAEGKIAAQLSKSGYVRQPQVNIIVVQYRSQQISVIGHVNKPGKYPVDEISTVVDLIALAGGVTPTGADTAILIKRVQGKYTSKEIDLIALFQKGDMSLNDELFNKDIIYVPRAPMFYIYGEVQRPGAYRLERDMTVTQALSLGGGPTLRGTERGMTIKRRNPAGPGKILTIDVQPSDLLQQDDVLYVREGLF